MNRKIEIVKDPIVFKVTGKYSLRITENKDPIVFKVTGKYSLSITENKCQYSTLLVSKEELKELYLIIEDTIKHDFNNIKDY